MEVEKHTMLHHRKHAGITAEGRPHLGFFDPEDIATPLKEIAFKHEQALAFVIYFAYTDSRTNVRREDNEDIIRWLKNGRYSWQWMDEDGRKGEAFVPDAVKMRHPHAFC
ncbi:hypothetical protein [Rufibacter latericius]|uniref:Uncharacterized protein n=1 Tax=Rufibacter latericius TaxID=2487040 RepID=A0A3M9MV82_9BACT|nr:hypothetical protein [Rufibacter latericius]RNI29095.1 hypothetical protein EFB08_06595 [Rufibacter latericius]